MLNEWVVSAMESLGVTDFAQRQQLAGAAFLKQGVTFNVYGDNKGTERIFPFDLMPRIIAQ